MTEIGGIIMKNRVLTSGLGFGLGMTPKQKLFIALGYLKPEDFGAVITRTLTLKPCSGKLDVDPLLSDWKWILPRYRKKLKAVYLKDRYGYYNNFGWWNPGIDYFLKNILPAFNKKRSDDRSNLIVSIGGFFLEDYEELVPRLNEVDIMAIEINASCSNVNVHLDSDDWCKIFEKVRNVSQHPIIVKVGIYDYLKLALAAKEEGFSAVHAINSIPAWHRNIKGKKCAYSGHSIYPIMMRVASEIKDKVGISVIAGGGICNVDRAEQALEIADAINLGTIMNKSRRAMKILRTLNS